MTEIAHFVKKEFQLDWRNRTLIGSILLYVISSIYVTHLAFQNAIDLPTWNSLFWIITLFTAFNASSKSFSQEERKFLYLYMLISPQKLLISKMLYNILLMLIIGSLSLFGFYLFISNEFLSTDNFWLYYLSVSLGAIGLAVILTMISAIASKTGNQTGMMAILGFPVIIPFLLATIKFSGETLIGKGLHLSGSYLLMMSAIIVMVGLLSYLLFPYIWRE
ncbi:MAG: heme exporter protein CcmB [Bacteroidota bacterium]